MVTRSSLNRRDLLDALALIQASPGYDSANILMFARAASFDALAAHLLVCARQLPPDSRQQVLTFLRSRAFPQPEPRPAWTPRQPCCGMPVLPSRKRAA